MSSHEEVRKSVSKTYANAVCAPTPEGSCCTPVQKGTLVKLAGYSRQETADLPKEVVVNSFGCGNPLAFSEVKEGDVVLDLGCGAGIDLLVAAKKVGPTGRVIGVDMTDEMIEMARRAIEKAGMTHNVEVRKGLIEEMPVVSESVDWVISNCVINLTPDKDAVFAEIARVLKPGGRMIVSDVVARDVPDDVMEDLERYHSCISGALSEGSYHAGLGKVGLVDVEVRERIEYTAPQLERLLESDFCASGASADCCSGVTGDGRNQATLFRELAAACEGKVWSAKVFAQKPV